MYCPIYKSTLALFSKNKLRFLYSLGLDECNIGNSGVKEISKADWPNLKILSVKDDTVTSDGLKNLRKACFNL
jgi:hypothetical protein